MCFACAPHSCSIGIRPHCRSTFFGVSPAAVCRCFFVGDRRCLPALAALADLCRNLPLLPLVWRRVPPFSGAPFSALFDAQSYRPFRRFVRSADSAHFQALCSERRFGAFFLLRRQKFYAPHPTFAPFYFRAPAFTAGRRIHFATFLVKRLSHCYGRSREAQNRCRIARNHTANSATHSPRLRSRSSRYPLALSCERGNAPYEPHSSILPRHSERFFCLRSGAHLAAGNVSRSERMFLTRANGPALRGYGIAAQKYGFPVQSPFSLSVCTILKQQ